MPSVVVAWGCRMIYLVCLETDPPPNPAVLLGSSVLEMYSLRVAFQGLRTSAREQGQEFWKFLLRGRDPTTAAVFAEDAGAVTGLALAGFSSYLTWVTGNPLYDALVRVRAVGGIMH